MTQLTLDLVSEEELETRGFYSERLIHTEYHVSLGFDDPFVFDSLEDAEDKYASMEPVGR